MTVLTLEPRLADDPREAIDMQLTLDSQLVFEAPAAERSAEGEAPAGAAEGLAAASAGVGGESSLDAVVSRMWEGLAAHQTVECPLCAGEMRPVYGAHPLPIGARCGRCETTLS